MVIGVPGERSVTFTVDGLDVGLENCAERGAGIIRKMEAAVPVLTDRR